MTKASYLATTEPNKDGKNFTMDEFLLQHIKGAIDRELTDDDFFDGISDRYVVYLAITRDMARMYKQEVLEVLG